MQHHWEVLCAAYALTRMPSPQYRRVAGIRAAKTAGFAALGRRSCDPFVNESQRLEILEEFICEISWSEQEMSR